jgi:hypothetical protein
MWAWMTFALVVMVNALLIAGWRTRRRSPQLNRSDEGE